MAPFFQLARIVEQKRKSETNLKFQDIRWSLFRNQRGKKRRAEEMKAQKCYGKMAIYLDLDFQ